MSKEQVAKELTLAIVDKLLPTDRNDAASFNTALVSEVAKAYNTFYELLNIDEEEFVVQS